MWWLRCWWLSPSQLKPRLPYPRVSMGLALVSSDQTVIMPVVAEDALALGSSSEVAIVRAVVNLDSFSPAEEVGESLKQKNSHLSQKTTTTAIEIVGKKRRLVKEFELVSSLKETSSSLPPRKSSSDKASKGRVTS